MAMWIVCIVMPYDDELGFGGCIRYVTGKDEAKILASDGVLLGTNAEIVQSFVLQRQLNPRIKKPVGHIALSFKPEDKPRLTDDFMAKIALVIDAVIHDMTMWIVRVVMPYDEELGIGDAHHLHVFKGYLSHELIRQTWLVLWFEAQCNVSHRLLNPWI